MSPLPSPRLLLGPGPSNVHPSVLAAMAAPGDVVVTMGAGDVTMLAPEIVTALQLRANRGSLRRPGESP